MISLIFLALSCAGARRYISGVGAHDLVMLTIREPQVARDRPDHDRVVVDGDDDGLFHRVESATGYGLARMMRQKAERSARLRTLRQPASLNQHSRTVAAPIDRSTGRIDEAGLPVTGRRIRHVNHTDGSDPILLAAACIESR